MQQRLIKSKGKTYLVNCTAWDDSGVGAGFSIGQLVLKSNTDGLWYVITCSGSVGTVTLAVSQSALPFTSGPIYQQSNVTASIVGYMDFYEQNFPYQILSSNDGNAYAVYLTNTAPSVTFVVSQSAYGPAYITNSYGAIVQMSKPFLLLQNITTGDYFQAGLTTTGGVTSISVNQTVISQSWVHPLY